MFQATRNKALEEKKLFEQMEKAVLNERDKLVKENKDKLAFIER